MITNSKAEQAASKFQVMLGLQNSLNIATNGANWAETGLTREGRVMNWGRCIYQETAELIDSYQWKHWKSLTDNADIDNAKIEVIDIMHFIMSQLLMSKAKEPLEEVMTIALKKSFAYIQKNGPKDVRPSAAANEAVLDLAEDLMMNSSVMAVSIRQRHDSLGDIGLIKDILENVFAIAIIYWGDDVVDEIFKLYIGKNVLNQFRQDHGYKDGSYIKIWNGDEDNVVMTEELNRLLKSNISVYEIEAALTEALGEKYPG